jgi:hypothetical protein
MTQPSPTEDALSLKEFDEFMAAESGMSVDEFRQRADKIEIDSLEDADLVEK